ncbi:MAG: ATP-binding protein [Burkholderiaceae bacterium]|nr:ATP-binding protein [Burkholderiaceae bacterium]
MDTANYTIWGAIFLATGIVFTIYILSIPIFMQSPKNQPTIIRMIGLTLGFGIFAVSSVTLINQSHFSDFQTALTSDQSLFVALAPIVFFCFYLQGVFILSIRKSLIERKLVFYLVTLFCLFALMLLGFSVHTKSFAFAFADLDSQFLAQLYRTIGFASLMVWIFYQTMLSRKKQENFILLLVQNLSALLFFKSIAWIVFLFINENTDQSLIAHLGGFNNLYFNIVIIRLGIFCTFEVLLTIFWIQKYSHFAVAERVKQERIQQLLLEKDLLIKNLSNTNTLIESGALSAGLAHEFNQFLARIEFNRDEIAHLINVSGVKAEDLKLPHDNIQKANNSAANLIVSLKNLFSRGEDKTSICNINDVVKDVVALYKVRIEKSDIKIVMDLQSTERHPILESLFRQVVVNLLTNSIDALDAISQDHKIIQLHSNTDLQGNYCLVLTNNGPGIPYDSGVKIFNLFATSKSSGSGIGLWLSRHIIERHQGSLTFKNLPDQGGVSFIVTLPPSALECNRLATL